MPPRATSSRRSSWALGPPRTVTATTAARARRTGSTRTSVVQRPPDRGASLMAGPARPRSAAAGSAETAGELRTLVVEEDALPHAGPQVGVGGEDGVAVAVARPHDEQDPIHEVLQDERIRVGHHGRTVHDHV